MSKYVLEPVFDETNVKGHMKGSLYISESNQLYWIPYSSISRYSIYKEKLNIHSNDPQIVKLISPKAREIKILNIKEDNCFRITFLYDPDFKRFMVPKTKMISLFIFFQRLVFLGMASPSYDKSCQFGLQLNPYYTEPIFNTCSHIQMKFPSGDDITFESLCSALINYTKDLLLEIDKTKGISNIQFPFDCAAKASHALLLEQIEKESESYFNGVTPITAAEFPHLFDCTGTLNEPHIFKNRLFLCGCDHEILTSVIPFAIGAYKLNSTSEDRKQLEHYWKEESARLSAQVSTAKKMPNNKSLRSNFSVILNDVERTDRREKAFANIDKPGPSMVTQVLNQYLVYNPSFGYIQGLNDHVVPFILAYFPKWNDEGYPIDDDGNIIDHSSFMPKLLWYFVSEIDNLCFDKYLMSIFKRALDMDRKVINYMESFSPLFVLWVKRKGMNNLNFFYPGIVLMLKRSCENVFDIWDIWIHIHTSPDPKNWFLCIVIAMVIHLFPLFQFDDNDLSCQTKISDVWENPLRYVRIKELKKTAIWVYRKKALPREYEERERKIDFENEFKIFEINNIE